MTRAARESDNHVSSSARWAARAREMYPGISDEQAAHVSEDLKRDYFRELGARGRQNQRDRAAREVQLEQPGLDQAAHEQG